MMSDNHVPYNTSPMSREERDKELSQSGTGTAEKPSAKKEKKGKKGKKESKSGQAE